MKQHPITISAKEHSGTIYIAEYSFGGKAKETAYAKVKRLILQDAKDYAAKSA